VRSNLNGERADVLFRNSVDLDEQAVGGLNPLFTGIFTVIFGGEESITALSGHDPSRLGKSSNSNSVDSVASASGGESNEGEGDFHRLTKVIIVNVLDVLA